MTNGFKEFINSYKELEKECRDQGFDIKELEDNLSENDGDKLRMCRYFRNFIQHSNGYETFLSITPGMQKFLDDILKKQQEKEDTVKKHIVKISNISCEPKDKVVDVLAKIAKNKLDYILVIEKDQIAGVLTVYELLKNNTKTAKIKDINKLSKKYIKIDSSVKMSDITLDGIMVCFEKDKPIGVIVE